MTALSPKLRAVKDGYGAKGFAHWCPGCREVHVVYYERGRRPKVTWDYNEDHANPTVSPSLRIDDEKGTRCHYFIENGKLKFCGDCRHGLSGATVEIPDWPYKPYEFGGVED